MATRAMSVFLSRTRELCYEPLGRRLRGLRAGQPVLDTEGALLLWEPRRVVPQYAVPEHDVAPGLLVPETEPEPGDAPDITWDHPDGGPVLPPGRFRLHTTPGEELMLSGPSGVQHGAAYRLDDPDLDGYVVLDFAALDSWLEEEDEVVAHPRDPFKRIDVVRSTRHVRVEDAGRLLAESRRPSMLVETGLPIRWYLPTSDVDLSALTPSESATWCAYKGRATWWSVPRGGRPLDVAWTYLEPRTDAVPVQGMVAFFTENLDLTLDGVRQDRPRTPWSD